MLGRGRERWSQITLHYALIGASLLVYPLLSISFRRLCKPDINVHILISQNAYSQNFSSICTKLWCRKTDGSGRCTSSVGGDGLRCGNKKVHISNRSLFNFQFRLYTVFHYEIFKNLYRGYLELSDILHRV